MTMFEKKNSVLDNTTDTGKTLSSNGNDTTTPENTVSASKGMKKFQMRKGMLWKIPCRSAWGSHLSPIPVKDFYLAFCRHFVNLTIILRK